MSADLSPPSRRDGIAYCAKVFLAVRIGLFVLGFLAATTIPARGIVTAPGWPQEPLTPGPHNFVTSFERQDATWFLRIATTGYRPADGSAAFFPLYPLSIRTLSAGLGGHPLAAGLLISNLAFFAALCVLFFLTASELSTQEARNTVLYLAVFPSAFFFFAPYSESLFLLAVVLSFWGARRGKWPVAGIAGALAALTRSVGIFLVPALIVEAIWQGREARRAGGETSARSDGGVGGTATRLVWSVFPALGTFAYLAYWKSQGSWTTPLRLQDYWQRKPSLPWMTLLHAVTVAWHDTKVFVSGYTLLDLVIVVPMLVAAVLVVKWFRPSYSVFVWLCILAPLSLIFAARPLMSVPRFLGVLFPLFWAMARETKKGRLPQPLVVGVSAAGLGLMTLLFVTSYYVF